MISHSDTFAAKIIAQADLKAKRLVSLLRRALASMLFLGLSYVVSQAEAAGLEGRQTKLNFLRLEAVAYFPIGATNFYFSNPARFRPWMSWVFNLAEVVLVSFQLYVDVCDPLTPSLLAFASPVSLIGTAGYKTKRLVQRIGRETEIAEHRKRFTPNEISDAMSDLNIEALRLGKQTDLAVLFVDIRGFSAPSVRHVPAGGRLDGRHDRAASFAGRADDHHSGLSLRPKQGLWTGRLRAYSAADVTDPSVATAGQPAEQSACPSGARLGVRHRRGRHWGHTPSAEQRNRKWAGDLSYIRRQDGGLYLAVILDLHLRRVIGWAVSNGMKRDLAIRALKMVIAFRSPPKDCIHHTDRGSQYCSHDYQRILRQHELKVSMSGKGNC